MRYSLLVMFLGFLSNLGQAQQAPGSPYTYFGVGDINNKGLSQQLITGGTGIANRSGYTINNLNPASYSAIGYPYSFLSEFGLSLSFAQRDDGDDSGFQLGLDFPYLAMAFKTGDRSGASFGLRQYSNVEYFIFGRDDFNGIPGTYNILYEGLGGLNEAYFGYGRNISSRLSVGAHFSYIFGSINNNQQINSFDRNFNLQIEDQNYLNTVKLDLGFQYMIPMNRSNLTIGATYDLKSDLSSSRELFITETAPGTSISVDSIALETIDSDEYLLPHAFGIGFNLNHRDKIQINMDFKTHLWSESSLSGDDYELRDSRRLSLGFEKLPNYKNETYFSRVSYGFGFFGEQSYLLLDGEGLDNAGFTAGLSLPLGSSGVFRIIGERASRGNGLTEFFSESYTKLTLSLTFIDFWFRKRKYN
ncbi:MAG: hypothetical protein AAF149_21690 [Bacteroidota bacterium]